MYQPASYAPWERRKDIGFRCASYRERDEMAAAAPVTWRKLPQSLLDVEDYQGIWSYPVQTAWNASRPQSSELGSRQATRIEFDAVYGDHERITCYVALPNRKVYAPPYQVVLLASGLHIEPEGSGRLWGSNLDWFETLVNAGRAVVVPTLYTVATNRHGTEYLEYPGPGDSERYKNNVARMGKDISRTIDFIERDQQLLGADLLDHRNIAYVGRCPKSMCWLVTDRLAKGHERFKAAVFPSVGLLNCPQPEEVDQLTYVPSITTPTLFLACEGHFEFQYNETQVPLYQLLQLADGRRRLHPVPNAPWIPTEDFDRQVNYDWLNKWMGKPRTSTSYFPISQNGY